MKPSLTVTGAADTVTVTPMEPHCLLTVSTYNNATRIVVSAEDLRRISLALLNASREMEAGK